MQIEVQDTDIIKKFKRNGHNINKASLGLAQQYIKKDSDQMKRLDTLVRKINQMLINSGNSFDENATRLAIQILEQSTDKNFKNYEDIVEDVRKWSTMYISPYENNPERFFEERPNPQLFKFTPDDQMKNDLKRFKQIDQHLRLHLKGSSSQWTIGMFYVDYQKTSTYNTDKPRMLLQNEASDMEMVFARTVSVPFFLVPGCTYAVRGQYQNKSSVLIVEEITIAPPLPEEKLSLSKLKFKAMCDRINAKKNALNFEARDFYRYGTLFNEERDLNKQTVIFGCVRLCKETVSRIERILSQLGNLVQSVFLMLDDAKHEEIDLKVWLKGFTVYLIPHVNSDGPRLLPKIPLMKQNYHATKVLTNPSRFSICSKEVAFLNVPLIKNIYEKNYEFDKNTTVSNQNSNLNMKNRNGPTNLLMPMQETQHQQSTIKNLDQTSMAKSVAELLFSQGSMSIVGDIFPRQNQYFELRQGMTVFVNDRACPLFEHEVKKATNFVAVGNFQRDGDFVCFMPKHKKMIQLCEEP